MRIAVLLSGGVDSSVALALLKQQGHDLTAFYLKIWLEDELSYMGQCPWEEDLKYATAVCRQLDVPLRIISLQREYFERVVSYAIEELKAGYTPSPDIFCNQRIKFGAFFDRINDSYEKVATGHYACLEKRQGALLLKTSPDPVKDQTYFLAHLSREQLARAMFPLGNRRKEEIRAFAREHNLATQNRKDSQGICFLGKIKFDDFVRFHLGERPGLIMEWETSKELGKHKGYWFHTIGQRHGLGLCAGPWYVVKKDLRRDIIYVSHKKHLAQQARDSFYVANFNWINAPKKNELKVKIRHGCKFYDCRLLFSNKRALHAPLQVVLGEKDSGIAAGQYAVFYDQDCCLGCGKIQIENATY